MSKLKSLLFCSNRFAAKLLANHSNRSIASSLIILTLIVIIFVIYIRFQIEFNQIDAQNRRLNHMLSQLKIMSSQRLSAADDNNQKGVESMIETDFEPNYESSALEVNTNLKTDKDFVVIYNRVPKTGSTSFMGIAYDLCATNHFNVLHLNTSKNSHVMSLSNQMRFSANVSQWRARLPALIHGHIAYVDFDRLGVKSVKPVYINIIRRPLDRLVSYYYFLRNGDNFRPNVIRRKNGDKRSFDECVEQRQHDCNPDIMWLQIPFFCGHVFECWQPGSDWALKEAKRNLVDKYLLVGVTEQIRDFVAMLEVTIPRFFAGALHLYDTGSKSHLRKTFNKLEPSPETVAKIQETKVWRMENDFYEFAVKQFNFIRNRTLSEANGQTMDRGKQFFFEKIRPKT